MRSIIADPSQTSVPLIPIDAGLMDPELLELSARPAIELLTESRERRVSLWLKNVDELPIDAAEVLQRWMHQFEHRLRCISSATVTFAELMNRASHAQNRVRQDTLPKTLAIELATIEVQIPSLATRRDELPALIAALLTKRMALGSLAEGISRPALDQLTIYPWPHDFAELDEAIRIAAMNCPRGAIQVEHLPLQIRSWRPGARPVAKNEPIELERALADVEAELIRKALARCSDSRTHAAKLLGISRAKLIRRIAELRIEQPFDDVHQDMANK